MTWRSVAGAGAGPVSPTKLDGRQGPGSYSVATMDARASLVKKEASNGGVLGSSSKAPASRLLQIYAWLDNSSAPIYLHILVTRRPFLELAYKCRLGSEPSAV